MNKVRIAVVGAGRLGGFHADKIAASEQSELAGVYDPVPAAARRLAEKHGVKVFGSLGEILPETDGVVVAAPSTEHGRLGKFFLTNGRHLLMEKPVATTADEAGALAAEAVARNLVLMAGHVEQCNPAWHAALPALREIASEGGGVIDAVRTSPYSFRCVDVGVVLDVMIHDLELVLSLVQSPVANVRASGFVQFGGHEDVCTAYVEFANGVTARFFASRVERAPVREMNAFGRARRVRVDFAKRTAEIIATDPAILAGDYAPEKIVYSEILPALPTFMKDHYRVEFHEKSPVDALALEEERFAGMIAAKMGGAPCQEFHDKGVDAVVLAGRILDLLRTGQAG